MAPSAADLARAAALIRSGGLVAFPTETVYGLGANALDPIAVARIFEAKQRPRFDPLIVHVPDLEAAASLVTDFPPSARALAERFWPGPLTLVLPKRDLVPDLVTAGHSTVAVRVPAHPVALALLAAADRPIAAPSANPFGAVSPTRAEHVREQLGRAVDLILDGGPCTIGVESTIIALTGPTPILLRPGGLPLEALEAVLGPIMIPAEHELTTLAPGRQSRHYAPRTPVILGDEAAARAYGPRIGLLTLGPVGAMKPHSTGPHGTARPLAEPGPGATSVEPGHLQPGDLWPGALEPLRPGPTSLQRGASTSPGTRIWAESSDAAPPPFAAVEILSPTGDLREAAAGLFSALRRLDSAGLDAILAPVVPEVGLGRAIADRLRRAAERRPIHVANTPG